MGSGTGSDIFGIVTFVLVVVVAVAAIAVIIYGRHLKERRLTAEKELIERREAAHVDAVVIEPAPADVAEDTSAAPAPAPKAAAKPKAVAAPKAKAAAQADKAAKAKASQPTVETVPPTDMAPKTKTPAKPKTEAAPRAAPAASAEPVATDDGDITQLKGLGPKLAATLAELGYTRLDQIAALTPAQATELDAKLGAFQGRMARDRWIEQATLLVAGDRDAYEAAFGKLG